MGRNTAKKVLVCGGFGFVGHYLVLGLLKKGHSVILMGRAEDAEKLRNRVSQLKSRNSRVNPDFRIDEEAYENLTVINGDIGVHRFGLDELQYDELVSTQFDEIWNAAAFLRYEEEYKEQNQKVNVDGVRRLLDLARRTGARFIQLSTAYIAGKDYADGSPILETFYSDQHFFNVYDASKAQAEWEIREHHETYGTDYLILRLPTVIGDSRTGFTISHFGYYEHLVAYDFVSKRCLPGETVRIMGHPVGKANFLPVDILTQAMLDIAASGAVAPHGIFTVADPSPLSYQQMCDINGEFYGMNIVCVLDMPDMTKNEKLLRRLSRKNEDFACSHFYFDSSCTAAALGHPVGEGWDKSAAFYWMVKHAYEEFCAECSSGE